MESSNLITDSSLTSLALQGQVNESGGETDAAKKKFAQDFEGVFINKLLDEMKNTIGEWSGEKDGAAQQIDGIFWMHLGNDLAEKGGFGMWKEIYNSLNGNAENAGTTQTLDKQL